MKIAIIGTGKAGLEYLMKHKAEVIDLKKAAVKYGDPAEYSLPVSIEAAKAFLDKAAKRPHLYENDEEAGTLKRTIVANTYNWLDSHDDVHLSGIFSKTISEKGKRIPHLHDHKFELSAKVGNPIRYFEKAIAWRDLGVDKAGNTEALFLESEILKEYNERVYKEYLNDRIDQHSVSMRYIKIDLAVNDEDYKDEFKVWQSVIDKLGNKATAEKQGYFFAVREASLGETSAVLLGSNELTPTLGKLQPLKDTEVKKPREYRTSNVKSLAASFKID